MTLEPLVRAGTTTLEPFSLLVTPEMAGWRFSGLAVLDLPPGGHATWRTGRDEVLVLPLSGGCQVACDDEQVTLTGRESVFSGVTDFAYVPRDSRLTVSTVDGGRFAIPSARASRRLPFRYAAAADVPVELRGAGQASRQVNNFCSPEAFAADRLIAVEVLTPGGNWSSYPPHKHDERCEGETELEEIYYFETSRPDGVGYQRVYGRSNRDADRPIDVCAEVRTGDVVLIPYGWHGPSMAPPGYDLYYLNVMAGPGERRWLFSDDPAHAWIRGTWAGQAVDPRLPMNGSTR